MEHLIAFRLSSEELAALDWLARLMEMDTRSQALRDIIFRTARARGYDAKKVAHLAKERGRPVDESVPEKVIDISGKDGGK